MRITDLFETAYRVYHGTNATFGAFDQRHLGSANGTAPINMTGFNFTDSEAVARTFGNRVIQCVVTLERPYIINARGKTYSEFKHRLNELLDRVDRKKHDGIIIRDYLDAGTHGTDYLPSNHYIPFSVDQIKCRINEAPIADLQYIDRSEEKVTFPHRSETTTRNNSFDDADRKAMTNPKWKAKVVHLFRNTPAPINVYAVNAKWLTVVDSQKGWSHNALTTDLGDLHAFTGNYDEESFKQTFGFLPPNWQNSINFTIVQNEGDDRHPLSGWMLAHRFIHAVLNDRTRWPERANPYRHAFNRAWRRIQHAVHIIEDHYGAYTISGMRSPPLKQKEIYAKLVTFGSARNQRIPRNRSGEFFIEIMTQYILRGDFDFHYEELINDQQEAEEIDMLIREAKEAMEEGLVAAVGQLIVF